MLEPMTTVLCAEPAVTSDLFTVMLADDFLMDYEPDVTVGLVQAFTSGDKSQLLVIEVDEPDISKYGFVIQSISDRVLRR
jgi:UTP-glucose-1-phosphate uridylyltransferase